MELYSDDYFMNEALKEAQLAAGDDEVPIGAVIVSNNRVIGRGHNMVEKLNDVTAHAEIIAITAASEYFRSKYLTECTIYVTIEPCVMCASAIGWAQIPKLVYGAADSKKGFTTISTKVLHPKTKVISGILKKECSLLVTDFFKQKR
jgi:tRNA(adenine34) deaminase